MRASELLGAEVVTVGGRRVGVVSGLRCSLDEGSTSGVSAPRLRQLLVTARHVGGSLGYQQEGQRGPWLVRRLIRALHRGSVVVDLDVVDRLESGRIHLSPDYR